MLQRSGFVLDASAMNLIMVEVKVNVMLCRDRSQAMVSVKILHMSLKEGSAAAVDKRWHIHHMNWRASVLPCRQFCPAMVHGCRFRPFSSWRSVPVRTGVERKVIRSAVDVPLPDRGLMKRPVGLRICKEYRHEAKGVFDECCKGRKYGKDPL